ncbi:RNA polymerase sigma-70 factor [Pedobacter sp. BS3]|uniref:RNA polymerase sigma-70 factor n=1 Tax=Pedobacter sp. BS3 TaxID=2567937 RepID=UPI0011ECEF13|nr:RNA polymerase sigma-70 factor [Pedobacter sp. BS3]TZF84920.1 RNA polymerase sigma-70 factor [Pedobacter sp. BS3]
MVSDIELWESVRIDNEKAFSLLFHRYASGIYSKAYSYIRDREVSEQIVHDIFLTIWNNRKTLQIQSFKGYLTSAARYRVYKHLTARKANLLDYKEELPEPGYAVQNTGYTNLTGKDLENELYSYLENLPKRCREIFLMSRIQLLSNDEIAKKLGISKRSVENQITYALKYLRISLKDASVILILAEGIHTLIR